jgi:hypothetical protein
MISGYKTKKIGEVLIENKYITSAMLEEALEHQKKHGGSLTQYLIAHNFVTEEDVAKCVSVQLGVPYLQLQHYTIDEFVIKLIPKVIVEKYWVVPVDLMKNTLTVVMMDPLDHEAIREVEKITGYSVQPFVGLISEIVKAIAEHYSIELKYSPDTHHGPPLSVPKEKGYYDGPEHRRSIRLPSNITVHFPDQDHYKLSKTKDVSCHGLLFESDNALPVGSFITLEVDLPKEYSPYPIAAVVQVARIVLREDKKFDIGVRVVKASKDDLETIISYASTSASIKRAKPSHE